MLDQLLERVDLLVAAALFAATLLIAFMWRRNAGGSRRGNAAASGFGPRRRTTLLLCGPSGAGKTTMWLRLTQAAHADSRGTQTSMVPNRAKAEGVLEDGAAYSFTAVDYPGHPRLTAELFDHIGTAKVVVVVVDAEAAADEHVGAHAAATLIAKLIEHKDMQGASLVVAAHKRDELTSYSAKALKSMLERELTTHFAARSGAVGSARVTGAKSATAGVTKRSETGLFLEEGEKFTFEAACSLPVSFVDTAAVGDTKFSLEPVIRTMM